MTKQITEIFGTQFCSNCQHHRPKEGGKYLVFNNGKNQRWRCMTCLSKRKDIK